jgi:hypothetical protein
MVRAATPGPQANRSDLLVPAVHPQIPGAPNGRPNQPDVQPTGLPYGQSQALNQSQAAAPVPNTQGSQLAQALEGARQMAPPGGTGLTELGAPTERPYEHIMTGASGPGGIGQPVAPQVPPTQGENSQVNSQLADLFDAISQASGSNRMKNLAQQARSAAQAAPSGQPPVPQAPAGPSALPSSPSPMSASPTPGA